MQRALERPEEQDTGLYDAFVSYSRKDIDFARALKTSLEESGRRVWIDLEGIQPTAEWLQEILRAIERSRAFLFLISPDSVLSRFANLEVSHAASHGKHIVPILYRPIEDGEAPEQIAKRQWVDAQPTRDFSEIQENLAAALDRDPAWVDFHTRLTLRAAEWQTRGFPRDLLLRGNELRAAVHELSIQADREPVPRQIHWDFIAASQRAARRRRARSTLLTLGIVCSIAVLALFGLDRLRRDVAQRRSAAALDAMERPSRSNGFPDRGLLLAAGGYLVRDTPATQSALLSALQTYPRLFAYLHRHQAPILAVGFVRSSGYAVTVDNRGHFYMWDPAKPEQPFKTGSVVAPEAGWFKAKLDEEGTRLAFGDQEGRVALCDLAVPKAQCRVGKVAPSGVGSLSFNPRTGELVSGHRDGTVAFLPASFPVGESVLRKVHSTPVHSLAFSHSGLSLASGEEAGPVYLWRLAGPEPVPRRLGSHPLVVWNLVFTEDDQLLATGDGAGGVYLWDLAAGTPEPLQLEGNEGTVLDITVTGKRLAASDAQGNLLLWDVRQRPPVRTILQRRGKANVWRHAFARGGDALIGLDSEGRIRSWSLTRDPVSEETLGVLDLPVQDFCQMISVDSKGEKIIAGDSQGHAALWRLGQLSPIGRAEVMPIHNLNSAAFAEAGAAAALTTYEDLVYWSLQTGAMHLTDKIGGESLRIANLALSADGRSLAVGGILNGLKVIELSGHGADVRDLGEFSAYSLSLSPDGRFLAGTPGDGGRLYLWDLGQAKPVLRSVEIEGRTVSATAFSRDSRYLVTGERDGRMYVWSVDGFPVAPAPLLGHDADITALTFSADSKILLTGDLKGRVLVWHFAGPSSEVRLSLQHQTYVTAVAIDPASQLIATADLDGRVLLWSARDGLLIGEIFTDLTKDVYGNRMYPYALSFDKKSERLSALFRDGRRVDWRIQPADWIEAACRIANRRLRDEDRVEDRFARPCGESRAPWD